MLDQFACFYFIVRLIIHDQYFSILIFFQSSVSPGDLQDIENEKLDRISSLSSSLLDLKKRQGQLAIERDKLIQEKCQRLKVMRMEEHKRKTADIDEKERELCRKTNELVDEFVRSCDKTPFHTALIQILGNLKGTFITIFVLFNYSIISFSIQISCHEHDEKQQQSLRK